MSRRLLTRRTWPRLCAGYVADAIGRKAKPELRPSSRAILTRVGKGEAQAAPAVGMGGEYRVSTADLAVATLVTQQRVAHLMAFPIAP